MNYAAEAGVLKGYLRQVRDAIDRGEPLSVVRDISGLGVAYADAQEALRVIDIRERLLRAFPRINLDG